MSIASSAMLVELSIGTWTARKLDKKVTSEVNINKRASDNASRVNKNLLPGVEKLDKITKYGAAVRNWMYTKTLPWSDFGARLIPTAQFFDFKRELDAKQAEFDQLVDEFIQEYPSLISMQAFKLGDMFDREEYPSPDDIRDKFKFNVAFMPVPESGDFRVDVGNDELQHLREQYDADFKRKLEQAMGDVSKRLLEGLSHLSERMTDYDDGKRKVFQSTLIERLGETIASVRALNVTKSQAIEQLAANAELAIRDVDVEILKEMPSAREKVKSQVDSIIASFNI
jgi:hypothetical protein